MRLIYLAFLPILQTGDQRVTFYLFKRRVISVPGVIPILHIRDQRSWRYIPILYIGNQRT